MKKKSFLFLSTPLIVIPTIFATSCSKPKSTSNENWYVIYSALNQGDIKISIDKSSTDTIKIFDLKNVIFSFSINEKIKTEENKNYVEKLEEQINKFDIKFVNYLLPIFEKDNESSVFFEIDNNSEKLVQINISSLYTSDNKSLVLTNLTSEEISKEIETNLNEDFSFVSDLQNKIKYIAIEPYKNSDMSIGFNEFWEEQKYNETIKEELEIFLANKYIFFSNSGYKNINVFDFVINNSLENEKTKKIEISFKISTTKKLEEQENIPYYQVWKIVFWI